jgi:hypothetical protein
MKFNNIILILKKSSYEFEVNDPVYKNSECIFCSENSSFGGYSFAYAGLIYKMLLPVVQFQNENPVYPLRKILSLDNLSKPIQICTPVIKNNRVEAKTLMNEILDISIKNRFCKIVFTHFIKINQFHHELNILGILDALKENNLNSELSIVLLIDENHIEAFEAILNEYNNA